MRNSNLLLFGVVGLGAYALYRASQTAPSNQLKTTPRPPDLPPPIALPQRIGVIPTPPTGTNVVQQPNELHPQFWYAGIADVFGTPAMNLPPSWLVGTLSTSGFGGSTVRPDAPEAASLPRGVQVYATPEEAASAGFPSWTTQGAGAGTRWFYGRWTGDVPTTAVPALIKLMWRAKPPGGGGF